MITKNITNAIGIQSSNNKGRAAKIAPATTATKNIIANMSNRKIIKPPFLYKKFVDTFVDTFLARGQKFEKVPTYI